MLTILLSMMAMAQNPNDLGAPPIQIRRSPTCKCAEEVETGTLLLDGFVVDAEVTLAPDGLSMSDRQATIFNISRSDDHEFKGRTKIWHSTRKSQCGMNFNYGSKYKLVVRKLENDPDDDKKNGGIETDQCLQKQRAE